MLQIPLSGPKGQDQYALVDDEDFQTASAYTWNLLPTGYAFTTTGRRKGKTGILLHRLIAGNPPEGHFVDHVDGNRLNNQQANLRFVTPMQNSQNTANHQDSSSRFKGVSWDNSRKLWAAYIRFNKKRIYLGRFISELGAARAYNAAAIQYHGEYARLNVIPDDAVEPVRYRQAVPYSHNSTSKYLGVCFSVQMQRWKAQIGVEGKNINIGHFDTEEQAARAYDTAAKLHHGNLAYLNFPD